MAATSSLLLSRELGINRSCVYSSPSKGKKDKGHTHIFAASLSCHTSLQEAWSIHLLKAARESIKPMPARCNILVCRSLFVPNGGNEIPLLKTAATVLTRAYQALHGQPLVVKLIPAVGIIAFAACGLGPLVRVVRILFLQSDNNWNKSRSHQMVTSYIQPLLLWGGAVLLCRTLEPIILPSAASQAVKQRLLNFVRSLSTVLAFAYCLSSLIQQTQKFFMEKKDPSDARTMGYEFAGKAVYSAVWVASVSLFMELLGFSTQKWVTAGGLGTVLLTLAGREIFTNFLSSVMIHATRPFVLNEWIQTKIEGYEVSGTVEHVGWWSPTIIRGDDREAVHIPNHKFTVNVVRNLSQKTHWRIKTHLAISHLDVNKINNIVADMRKVLAKNPQVEQQKLHRRVFLDNVDPENQALLIMVSCFVKTSHFEEYLGVKEAILLDLLRVISHHRARLATPIRTVQKVYSDADIDSVPFSDIFSRNRAAANRPFLLIEPSYKVNGDDKTKPSKVGAPVTLDPTTEVKTSSVGPTGSVRTNSDKPPTNPDGKPAPPPFTASTKQEGEKPLAPRSALEDNIVLGAKQEGEKPLAPRPALDDNIVLGVALEGSKPSPPPSPPPSTASTKQEGEKPLAPRSALDDNIVLGVAQEGSKPSPPPSTATAKQEGEKPLAPRSALEDNIVLGVALEGSKRMLPIEDEMGPASKELATTIGKDKKDDQSSLSPGATPSEQREQEKR